MKTGLICGTIYLGEQVKKEALFMAVDHTQYKDRLFNFLFGSEENKAWTLSLYNAVNGSNYTDPDAIQITTIKEVMYLACTMTSLF